MRGILSYCKGFQEATVAPGEVLLSEGGRKGALYILIEGKVEVLKGDLRVSTVREPAAIFGEISVLLDVPHTATVRALAPSRFYVVERASEFLQSHTDIAYQLARVLAQRLQSMTTYLVDVKRQFGGQGNHLDMVDEILGTLVQQQDEECTPGSERYPDTTI